MCFITKQAKINLKSACKPSKLPKKTWRPCRSEYQIESIKTLTQHCMYVSIDISCQNHIWDMNLHKIVSDQRINSFVSGAHIIKDIDSIYMSIVQFNLVM